MELLLSPTALSLLTRVKNFLAKQNVQAYVVGGFVRDLLLARDTADIGIARAADALEVAPGLAAALGGKYVPLDKVNRVGRVLSSRGTPPDTGKWQIDLSTLEAGIEHDLKKRDFTIDAMAIDLNRITTLSPQALPGEPARDRLALIDPFNGLKDIQQRVIRAVSQSVFELDAARLLRAVRLAAELGFTISKETEALIRHRAHLTSDVAGERLREELVRLFGAPETGVLLRYLEQLG